MTKRKLWLSGKYSQVYAIVDQEDYKELSQFKWYLHNMGYATTTIDKHMVYMHRLVMKPPNNMHIDHINHEKLDNRKSNLRIVTREENMQNRKLGKGSVKKLTVGKYVYWVGEIRKDHERYYTVTCKTQEQAQGALKQYIKDKFN